MNNQENYELEHFKIWLNDVSELLVQDFWISQKTPELSEAWEKNVRPYYISLRKIRRYVKHNVNPFENDFNKKDLENLWCLACFVHEDEEALREINHLIYSWLKRFE